MTAQGATAVPWRSRVLQAVLASTLVLPLGVPLVSPLLPLYGSVFAVSDLHASLLLTVYFLPVVVLSPLVGVALDRYGRRAVLVVSLAGFGLLGLSLVLVTEFSHLLAVRLAQGVAAAGVFCATVTVIADAFEGVQRHAAFGVNVAVLAVGRSLYPVLGGALADHGWRVPFLTYGLAVLAAGFVAVALEDSGPAAQPERRARPAARFAALAAGPARWYLAATVAAEAVIFGAIYTTLPFLLAADHGATPLTTGAVLTVTTVAAAVVAAGNGALAGRVAGPRLVAGGFVLFGVSLLGLGVAPGPLAAAAVAALFGAGIGVVLPSVDAALSDAVPPASSASAMGARNSATGLGKAAGPVLFTAAAGVVEYRTLLLIAAAGTLAVGLVALGAGGGRWRRWRGPGPGLQVR